MRPMRRGERAVRAIGRARAEGRKAAAEGLEVWTNPYPLYGKLREHWLDAFQSERDAMEADERIRA